jgi:hypothetical protein
VGLHSERDARGILHGLSQSYSKRSNRFPVLISGGLCPLMAYAKRYAVCCPAVANFLALTCNCQSISLDDKGLDRVRYVLEIFWPRLR